MTAALSLACWEHCGLWWWPGCASFKNVFKRWTAFEIEIIFPLLWTMEKCTLVMRPVSSHTLFCVLKKMGVLVNCFFFLWFVLFCFVSCLILYIWKDREIKGPLNQLLYRHVVWREHLQYFSSSWTRECKNFKGTEVCRPCLPPLDEVTHIFWCLPVSPRASLKI